MQLLAFVLLGLVLAFDPAAVSATKVVQCKTTYRGRLEEPSVAGHRSLCSLYTNLMDNSDMCLTTDTRGDNSGYYSVANDAPTLCLTIIYNMKNVAYDIDDIVLYRGQSELPGVNNCSQVCSVLSNLIPEIPDIAIHYVGCVTTENGNDEEVDQINYYSPTNYTCNTSDNYAKPGDPGRPGSPSPLPTRTTHSFSSTTKPTTMPTTSERTTTTKSTNGLTTLAPTTITELTTESNIEATTSGPITITETTTEPTTTGTEATTPEPVTTTEPTTTGTEATTPEPVTTTEPTPSSETTDNTPTTTESFDTSSADIDTSQSTAAADTGSPFEAAEVAAEVAAKVAAEVVGKVVKRAQEIQTREAAATDAPSWTWPVMGSLVGLLALMVVSLAVELVIARLIFKEVAKVGVSDDIPMS